MAEVREVLEVAKRPKTFSVALFAVILLSNYVLSLFDTMISVLSRDGAQVPALQVVNMVLGPAFLILFVRLFILILRNSLFLAPSESFVVPYRYLARTMLLAGMGLTLSTLLQTYGHPAMFLLPPMYAAMSLNVWYGSLRGNGTLQSVLYYLALLLMVVSAVYITPILHYRNVFFQGSQLMTWVAYAYCRRYALTAHSLSPLQR
ncbi:MAG: hypothetical protein KGZ64_09125 [Thermaerobacter sp.]|nr:hypothetical protein [Thermaerobacter sp.]